MILVTGSSGHIGNVLVRELVQSGEEAALFTKTGKKPEWLEDLDLLVYKGDLKSKDDIDKAVQNAKVVFHLGGLISISSFASKELHEVNVLGTQYILDACKKYGVEKLIYTSSVHALPEGKKGSLIKADKNVDISNLFGAYATSKADATRRVNTAIDEGLNAVICFPSGVMGPHDFRGSEAGRMIKDYATNKLPVYIGGKYNFVDVRDVVQGLIQSWKVGKPGASYILSGEEMSLEQFFDILADIEPKMKKPKIKMPTSLALGSAWVLEFTCRILNLKPLFTAYAIKVLQSNCNFYNENSKQELGFNPRPIKDTIKDSLLWLKDNKLI